MVGVIGVCADAQPVTLKKSIIPTITSIFLMKIFMKIVYHFDKIPLPFYSFLFYLDTVWFVKIFLIQLNNTTMKTHQFFVVMIMMVITPIFAQTGTVGINTSNPRSTLEINGTLRIDSAYPIIHPKKFVVFSDSNTVDYIAFDSLQKQLSQPDPSDPCDLDGKVIPELYFSSPGTYMDDCDHWVGGPYNISSLLLITHDPENYTARRDLFLDWSIANACYNRIKIGSDIFVFLYNNIVKEYRVYHYIYGSLSSGGTLITLTGQIIPINPTGIPRLFYDGMYFLVTYKAGNASNQFIVSRYTFNGTSLVYIDDITFTPPALLATYTIYSLQKEGNFYYAQMTINPNETSISKYNNDGSYAGIEKRLYTVGSNNIHLVNIGSKLYLYYTFGGGPTLSFRKLNPF